MPSGRISLARVSRLTQWGLQKPTDTLRSRTSQGESAARSTDLRDVTDTGPSPRRAVKLPDQNPSAHRQLSALLGCCPGRFGAATDLTKHRRGEDDSFSEIRLVDE
jgi:hypothetical protein